MSQIITQDIADYGYLFPGEDVPKIKSHIFSDMSDKDTPMNERIVRYMMDPDYIGWTAKELLGLDLFPFQLVILQTLWKTPFPMLVASRGAAKTFTLAVYCIIRAILDQGTKIVLVGGGLRQAKMVFGYMETIWNNSSIFRSIAGGGKKSGPRIGIDLCYFNIGRSVVYALPLGDGQRIRGFRASIVIADEFASIPEDIFNVVVRGFAATSKTPVDDAKMKDLRNRLAKMGVEPEINELITTEDKTLRGNQIIYSGSAYYQFNHFCKRYTLWQKIIKSKGDPAVVAELFGNTVIPKDFNYKDYAVIQIPYTHVPEGLLEEKMIADAQANLPKSIFLMEYGSLFIKDSDGHFPRSLIEECTTQLSKPIMTSDGPVCFTGRLHGDDRLEYIMGVDPAAEGDKFAIVLIEVHPRHYRIVYCWSINKVEFKKRKKDGLTTSDSYYKYCCNKIRQLIKDFRVINIQMDSQGGGYAISDMLGDKDLLDAGEFPIYEVIVQDEPKDSDSLPGHHILSLVKQGSEYNQQANAVLHKSFETKTLLFPHFDVVKITSALLAEKEKKIFFDTFEDNANEIEELKNEICTIQKTETTTGKERFDTPNVAAAGATEGRPKKGKLRKDRYTALLLAHKYLYESKTTIVYPINYEDVAGNFKMVEAKPGEGLYKGPGVGHFKNADSLRQGQIPYGGLKRGDRI